MATGPLDATLKVEAAWGDDWKTASPTWTDITSYVRSLTCRRGRRHELAQYEAGTMTLTLDNSDRRFEPEYAGAYYPDIVPGVPIRLTAAYGSNLLDDEYATVVGATIDAGASDHFTGVNASSTVEAAPIGKYPSVAATATGAAAVTIDAGAELDDISVSGSTQYTVSVYVVSSDTLREARVVATDYDASQVEGDTTNGSYVEDISNDRGAPTRVTVTHTTASDADHLRIRVQLRKNAGTNPDVGDILYISMLQLETGASASTWAPKGQRAIWRGFTERFALTYPGAASDAVVTLSCVDGFKWLNKAQIETYRDVVLSDRPLVYWPMDEAGYVEARDISAYGRGRWDRTTYAAGDPWDSSAGAHFSSPIDLEGGMTLFGDGAPLAAEGKAMTFECWFRSDSANSRSGRFIAFNEDGAGTSKPLIVGVSVQDIYVSWTTTGASTTSLTVETNHSTNTWYHLVITRDPDTNTLTGYLDGTSKSTTGTWNADPDVAASATYSVANGWISGGDEIEGDICHMALYDYLLDTDAITRHANASRPNDPSESPDTRIGTWLDEIGWPAGNRDLDAGAVTLAGGRVTARSVLSLLRGVARTEDGFVYMGADGSVVFKDRTSRDDHSDQSAYTFGPSDLDHQEAGFTAFYDDSLIYNQIRVGGTGHSTVEVNDTTSQTAYGIRTLSYNIEPVLEQRTVQVQDPFWNTGTWHTAYFDTGTDLDALADAIISRTKDPHLRVPRFTVQPQGDPTNLWPAVITLDIGDRVTVEVDPPGGGANLSLDLFIEGITHTITPGQWLTTYDTAPALASGY